MRNPFEAGTFQGRQLYHTNGPDRVEQVRSFDLKECEAGLQVPGVQKTVQRALNSRIKKLKAAA
ncbi:MAG: hypothetical protein JKY50_07290 [Oleispira sp.]|nr:hypothetical protein [Oleispira sp.]MBL4881195.1 hypothetical protein [Oleispira sp.]